MSERRARLMRSTVARRVGLIGEVGMGNIGNDASMEAVLAYFRTRHPNATLDSLCSNADIVRARYGVPASSMAWYSQQRRAPARWPYF